ncbi:hypothetical protein UPYG_G00123840 [Umbra pygmaea]|uniref:Uncharacterized protein n=1 Tax=Umbra pygmaea TaxID=75934 RepID=A0ABD0XMW0_UMBPY
MGRCKRRGSTITRRGLCSQSRKDTPLKSVGRRAKVERFQSKPVYTRHKGLVLSIVNESTQRSDSSTALQINRMPGPQDTESTIHSSTDDTSDLPEGSNSLLSDETDSSNISSSSQASPEVFRAEDIYAETVVFPGEVLDLHVKNSTLLDVSHAENINTQWLPNVSSIVDISQVKGEMDQEKSQLAIPLKWTPSDKLYNAYESMEKTPVSGKGAVPTLLPKKTQKPAMMTRHREIKCKKKVTFSDSISTKMILKNVEPVTEGTGEPEGNRETAFPPEVPHVPRRATHHWSEQTKFFDFADLKERDTFFEFLRKKYSMMLNIFTSADQHLTGGFEEEGDAVW